jgi:hypothetical protein
MSLIGKFYFITKSKVYNENFNLIQMFSKNLIKHLQLLLLQNTRCWTRLLWHGKLGLRSSQDSHRFQTFNDPVSTSYHELPIRSEQIDLLHIYQNAPRYQCSAIDFSLIFRFHKFKLPRLASELNTN